MANPAFNIALIQLSMGTDVESNLVSLRQEIETAARQGANIVLLPELHNYRYFCQNIDPVNFRYAEEIPGPTSRQLAILADKLDIIVIASIFEKRAPGIYHNTALVLDHNGDVAGIYRKMHIPDDPGYYEKYYFTPGDQGFKPISTKFGNLGVMVCWDQWFPEAARIMALQGADILLYPTAIGWDPADSDAEKRRQIDAWEIIQRSHAIANGIPVAVCNRLGLELDPHEKSSGIDFWGASFIAGPQGDVLAQAPHDKAIILSAKIDLARNESVRQTWPYFRDRRTDAYGDILVRFHD